MTTENNEITLGQLIGSQKRACKVSPDGKNGPSATISINVDFSTASDNEIISWLLSDRVIAGQRPWRSLSIDEIKELDGTTFVAQNIGQKVKSRSEQIAAFQAAFISAGIDEEQATILATAAVDNPTALDVRE